MADQLDAQLDELETLLEALSDSLPEPTVTESLYSGLLNFSLDPEWERDVGIVGAVNRGLEVIWGSRAQGLCIKERGHTVQAVAGVLRFYMYLHPGDIILQKWLDDLIEAASNIISRTSPKITVDLKRKRSQIESEISSDCTSPATPDDSSVASDWGRSVPGSESECASDSESCMQSGESHSESESESLRVVLPSLKRKPKKKPKSKRKTAVKIGPAFNAIASEHDPRFIDVESTPQSSTSHLGAPPDLLARKLTRGCHPAGETPSDKNHYFRCLASSICNWQNKNTRRQRARIYKHSSRCRALERMNPELYALAQAGYATMAPSAQLDDQPGASKQTENANTSADEASDVDKDKLGKFWAGFTKQGANDIYAKINLAIVRLICASGTPPSIADCEEWQGLFDAINPKLKCDPPSATTLRDKLIPAESAKVNLLMKKHIKTQHNLTLSFDGLTEGSQPLYTVHVITPERDVFLYEGDVFTGSHNAAYIQDLIQR
ncbi:hypothetical protein BDV93DRAFT_566431, partial [Ceratobasidium sp. AG-I]